MMTSYYDMQCTAKSTAPILGISYVPIALNVDYSYRGSLQIMCTAEACGTYVRIGRGLSP